MEKIDTLVQKYIQFFSNSIKVEKLNYGYAISVPLLDRHNDCLEFYVDFNDDGTIHLTDDGYTLDELETYGIKFNKKNTKKNTYFNTILNVNNIKINDNMELVKDFKEEDFAFETQLFIQGMINIGDFYLTDNKGTQDNFFDKLESILINLSLPYKKDVTLKGNNKVSTTFNYRIDGHDHSVYTKIISNTKNDAYASMFVWENIPEKEKGNDVMLLIVKKDSGIDDDFLSLTEEKGIGVASRKNEQDILNKLKAI